MKISKFHSRPVPSNMFGRLHRLIGNRAYVTFFADDDKHTGVGSTPQEAAKDLRSMRSLVARNGYEETP